MVGYGWLACSTRGWCHNEPQPSQAYIHDYYNVEVLESIIIILSLSDLIRINSYITILFF